MTGQDGTVKPEHAFALALSFSGQTLRYQLDWRAALAWERLSRKLTRRDIGILAAIMFATGLTAAVVEPFLPMQYGHLPVLLRRIVAAAAGYLLFLLLYRIKQCRLAIKRYPHPIAVTLEIGPDRAHQWQTGRIGNESEQMFTPEFTFQSVTTPDYVFVEDVLALLIIPATAFAHPDDMRRFVTDWDRFGGAGDAA